MEKKMFIFWSSSVRKLKKEIVTIIAMAFSLLASPLVSDMSSDISERTKAIQEEYREKNINKALETMSIEAKASYANLQKLRDDVNEKQKVLIYLTSQTVPALSHIRITKEVARFRKEGLNIQIAPIVRGFDDSVIKYAKELHVEYSKLPPLSRSGVKSATRKLKINPQMFLDLNITRVPAMITAVCNGQKISSDNCEFIYKAVGDTSLYKMSEIANVSVSNMFKGKNNE